MAKKNKAKKNRVQQSVAAVQSPTAEAVSPGGGGMYAARETIESIVIAFVLAFLFRTFEAEAFVIPTGSMSPSLQGQHKDVCCSACGYRFRTSASTEGEERQRYIAQRRSRQDIESVDVIAGQCPMCRQTMLMRPDFPADVPPYINTEGIETQDSYPGDRILVNKYCYNNRDPERWDVVVFKFPGNGEMNYIKRLIGLPNETLRIYQGDIFIRKDEPGAKFQIERKPADKVRAMLQPVHDTDYDPSLLYNAGWPLRWEAATPEGWQVEAKSEKQTVQQQYRVETAATGEEEPVNWLRYRHFVPQNDDWAVARAYQETGKYPGINKQQWLNEIRPELIRDYNPYNAVRLRGGKRSHQRERRSDGILDANGWAMPEEKHSLHWVGDLAIECEVEVESSSGALHLDLVEAGQHFSCRIDLETGQATVAVEGFDALTATAPTPVNSSGTYRLLFANVDDQLILWVDGKLIELTESAPGLQYEAELVYGNREKAIPATSESDLADLAPASIGAQGAKLKVNHLQVLRDIYYIATSWRQQSNGMCDYPHPRSSFQLDASKRMPALESVRQLFTDPDTWSRFSKRREEDFEINDAQLFVMGDNSPASQDCRLWASANPIDGSKPGGPYLDRRLLIGKAVCVFWPHSWGGIGPLPGFPNFGDMRLVR